MMKSSLCGFVAVLALSAALVSPGGAQPVAAPAGPAQERDRLGQALEGHIRFLADDLLEGRGLGQRGHEIAARYIAAQFAAIGLVPAGDGAGADAWFQRINFAERAFSSSSETLTFDAGGKSLRWVNGVDAAFGPGAVQGPETVTAPLVFVGFGIRDKALGIDDYAGLDVRGKIVVALSGAHPGMNSEVAAHLARTNKAIAAMEGGAVGLVQVRTLVEQERLPFEKLASRVRIPARGLLTPEGEPIGDGSALKLRGTLSEPAATALFAGAPMDLQQVLAAAAKAPVKGFALAGTLTVQRAQTIKRITSPNVLGLLPGADRSLSAQIVLVQAHSDHLGLKADAAPGSDAIFNGAMDNASGTATLIETARLVASGKRPARSILFLATTGEESGLLGADYWSRRPTLPISRVVGVVNIDMPILSCDFGDIVAFGADRSTLIDPVSAAARSERLKVSPDPQPEEAVFTRSDHYPMVRAGIPSVFLKTGHMDTRGGMLCRDVERDFRLNRYHELGDDMNQAFDWSAAAKFARVNTAITLGIANGRTAPRWFAGDYFGDSFAPAAPKAKAR